MFLARVLAMNGICGLLAKRLELATLPWLWWLLLLLLRPLLRLLSLDGYRWWLEGGALAGVAPAADEDPDDLY